MKHEECDIPRHGGTIGNRLVDKVDIFSLFNTEDIDTGLPYILILKGMVQQEGQRNFDQFMLALDVASLALGVAEVKFALSAVSNSTKLARAFRLALGSADIAATTADIICQGTKYDTKVCEDWQKISVYVQLGIVSASAADLLYNSLRNNQKLQDEILELGDEVIEGVVKNLDDLKVWAKNIGLESLTDVEIKGIFDLFEGNIAFSQKALLSTKEIVSGKNLDELASHFNLPMNPSAQSLTPYQARIWYSWRKSKISTLINKSNGLENAAKEALEMRNTIRATTRQSMIDTDIADFLNAKEMNMTWAEAMSKYNGDYNEIIEASMRGRGLVDVLYKIPK